MRRTASLRAMLWLFLLTVLCGTSRVAWAQTPKPVGIPFDAGTSLNIESPPPAGVAIKAGRLFDPRTGTNLLNQVILIKGDKIVDVGPADKIQIPAGATVIDLSQETVLPGLIDMHVHLFNTPQAPNESRREVRAVNFALRDVLGGFTTLTDMGSRDTYGSVELRDAINKGWIPGPRLQVAGPHLNPGHGVYPAPSVPQPFGFGVGSPTWQVTSNTNSPWLMTEAVREHARYGVDLVKMYTTDDYSGSGYWADRADPRPGALTPPQGAFKPDGTMNSYPSMSLEEARAGVVEAHRRGLTVASHSYGGEGLRVSLEAGIDLPMHVAAGVTGAIGLDDETIRLFKVPLDNGKQRPVIQTLWDLMGGMEAGNLASTAHSANGPRTIFGVTELSFKRLVAAGIPEVFGSGVYEYGHGTQACQFPIYVKWGMSPADALRMATSNAAAALNYDLGNYVGYVEKGRFADIIAVPGDPLKDINTMESIKFVMKGGAIFRNEFAPGAVPLNLSRPPGAGGSGGGESGGAEND
jgi:imidazolonepropionase-like amidohydrolase